MRKDARRPWYRWSPADFRADPAVYGMNREQRWRYRDALDSSWLSETPGYATESQWCQWLGYGDVNGAEWGSVRSAFAGAFTISADGWVQKRLSAEHALATRRTNAAVAAGVQRQVSARSAPAQRPVSGRSAVAIEREEIEEIEEIEVNTPETLRAPEPVTSSVMEPESPPKTRPKKSASKDWVESFTADFWPAYRRPVGKGAALFAWLRLGSGLDPEAEKTLFNAIMDGLEQWNERHKADELEFIPHPATWLNQRRWEDEA